MRISDWSSDVCSSDLLLDIRADKTGHHALGVDVRQLDRGVQVRQLSFQLTRQLAGLGLMLLGFLDLLAQCGGVHENSRKQGNEERKKRVEGRRGSVRIDRGGRQIKKKKKNAYN